jgi:uncharacterized protein DUF5906
MLYRQNDSVFEVNDDGLGRPKKMEEVDLIKILRNKGIDLVDIPLALPNFINSLPFRKSKEQLKSDKEQAIADLYNTKIDIISSINPFKHLKIIESDNSEKLLVMMEFKNKIQILGTLESLNARELVNLISTYTPDIMVQLFEKLAPLLFPKDPTLATEIDLIQSCLNILQPKNTLERIKIQNEDIHPAVVEGCEVVSLKKIPYTQMKVRREALNPYLIEFLSRVDNHEHLCAIFWAQVYGLQLPYICYLYGKDGREGKTSFINMLSRITGSFANLTEDGRFVFSALYGKSIIMVPENERSRLVSSRTVKAITGGNLLSIEEKGKKAFSGKIRGTIIVDANIPLNITGKGFETERLRYFVVKPHNINKNERLSPEEYTKELGSTQNEFLNYCRQCFEMLKTPGGMLIEPENHHDLMESLADEEQNYEYKQITTKICAENGFKIGENLSIEVGHLLSLAKKASTNRGIFYSNSYKHYLEKCHNIKEDNKMFSGIGYKETKGTIFKEPQNNIDNYKE